MAELAILKHMHDLSDEVLCERLVSVYPATNVEIYSRWWHSHGCNPQARGIQSDFSTHKAS